MTTEDLLTRVARGHDRNVAPFFAGRDAEMESFEGAIEDAKHEAQTQFLIFQGAPGCGKTSLLAHLRENAPERRVFVEIAEDDTLTSAPALGRCIDDAVAVSPSPWVGALGPAVRALGKLGGAIIPGVDSATDTVASAWGDAATARRLRRFELVLVCDEAQVLNENHAGVLRMLHKSGLRGGITSVLALAGLSHTGSNLRRLPGLSRLSANAEVSMGLLSEDECAASTRTMLAQCGIAGSESLHEQTARHVGVMAQSWPQHLTCAQAALASELLRVDRALERIDLGTVLRETTEARHRYYRGRIEDHPVLENPRLTARLVGEVQGRSVSQSWQLADVCQIVLEHPDTPERLRQRGDPEQLAKDVVAKGILGKRSGEPYRATIPSMATWLGEQPAPDDPARQHLNHGH